MTDEPPPYSLVSQPSQQLLSIGKSPLFGKRTENLIEGGPKAQPPFHIPFELENLSSKLEDFQKESNQKNQVPINPLDECGEIAKKLVSKYQSDKFESKTGGIRIRHFKKEFYEKLDSGNYEILQPYKSGDMDQFQKYTPPILMQYIDSKNVENSYKDFMKFPVKDDTESGESSLKQWIKNKLDNRRIKVNEGELFTTLEKNFLKAMAFLPPVNLDTKGEKAVITGQPIKANEENEENHSHFIAVLKHQKDKDGQSFYSDEDTRVRKKAYGKEYLILNDKYLTVEPVSNNILTTLFAHKDDKKVTHELDNLVNQHYILISVELEKIPTINNSSSMLRTNNDIEPDGLSKSSSLIPRGGNPSPLKNILSNIDTLPNSTQPVKKLDPTELYGDHKILAANITILGLGTLKISKHEENLTEELIDHLMGDSIKRLGSAVVRGEPTGQFVHERKENLTRFRNFMAQHFTQSTTSVETPNHQQQSLAPR